MLITILITEGVWEAAIDAGRQAAPADANIVLLHVISDESVALMRGAAVGLLGRRRPGFGEATDALADASQTLIADAQMRLARPADIQIRRGQIEREVVMAVADADLLVMSRDGDQSRLGPHSIGRTSRFILDHAPCAVLLVWPGQPPQVGTIPPPPGGPPPAPPAPPSRR